MKGTLLSRKRIQTKANRTDGIINFDVDNAYPSRTIDIIQNSVTGTACVELYKKFIFGRGFKDKDFYKLVVNKNGLTNDKLLRLLAGYLSIHKGYALHFNFNILGKITEITPVPYRYCREVDDENDEAHEGMICVYDNWDKSKGSRINKADFQYFNKFNLKNVQAEISRAGGVQNYVGQILFTGYCLSKADPVFEDMLSEGEAKIYKLRNISTNFMASHLLIVDKFEDSGIGSEITLTGDVNADGNATIRSRNEGNEARRSFIENLEKFQGADEAAKIFLIERDSPDQSFDLRKVDIQDVDKLFQFTENSCRDNIIRCFNQPPILVGVQVAGKLGTSKEIKDATDYYNIVTESERIELEELFKMIFENWYIQGVNKSNDFSILPVKSELNVADIPSSLVTIITSMIPVEQKKGFLIGIAGYTEEEANLILNIKPNVAS
jgi:hypothetical protein